jgi:hypothetical protein
MSHGDARWLLPDGEFTYGEFDVESVEYNTTPSASRTAEPLDVSRP